MYSSSSHSVQTVLSTERPDTWFIESHPMDSYDMMADSSNSSSSNNNTNLQIVSHPWTYPEHHQEIVGRPDSWLGGSNASSPVRRTKRIGTTIGRENLYRNRPEPIAIEGLTLSPIKNSPFLR